MEELQAKHRKELRDLQARITQKKKAATKKTRKGVNDECARLEEELKTRQAEEIGALSGGPPAGDGVADDHKNPASPDADGNAQPPSEIAGDSSALEDKVSGLSISPAAQTPEKKPNRQKARLARRAAEQERLASEAAAEAADMPDMKARERAAMLESFKRLGLREREIRADGHCLYAAVADQLQARGVPLQGGEANAQGGKASAQGDGFRVVRNVAANYIAENPDTFVPYLEEDLESYVAKVRDTGEWGGQIELLALANAYKSKISVLQGDGSVVDVGEGEDDARLWVAYYRHGFGLGEHYNSLRKEP
jgi:OTU domain-containing protein 6